MSLVSNGYCNNSTVEDIDQDWQLFSANLDLLLNNEQKILNCAEYFFTSTSFMYCSFPYIQGDGKLPLGYLLLFWRNGILTEKCSGCSLTNKVLVASFSGSPLSGSNSWSGICVTCRQKQQGTQSKLFKQWLDFVQKLRQTFPAVVQEIEESDGYQFCWGGSGLQPVKKTRIISKPVCKPVTLKVLIEELATGNVRTGRPVNVQLLKKDVALKLSKSLQKETVHFRL